MSIADQLNVLLHPRGPLTYEQVRFYLTENGFTKPGKGMKHLVFTIQNSSDPVTIVKDLKDTVDIMKRQKPEPARKKPGPKPGFKRKKNETDEPEIADEDEEVNRRLNEALAIRGKTQHGTLIRRVKRLMDALDEEDAEEDPVIEKDDSGKDDDLFGPSDD